MTQPTSVNMTFDTSLVDLNSSFSTTESDPSDLGVSNPMASTIKTPTLQQHPFEKEQSQETPKQSQATTLATGIVSPPKVSSSVQSMSTQDAYDQWAAVYDSDGNMLQSVDDFELATLLPELLSHVLYTSSTPSLKLLDLGCGTGRNTAKLLSHIWPQNRSINITALDFSKGMLDIAAQKLCPLAAQNKTLTLRLDQCDCFPTVSNSSASPFPVVHGLQPSDAVISTLVLEHVPLADYFSTLVTLVSQNGHALVTNMHSEMGRVSQAGFINEHGVKVRGQSFAHTPEETVAEAQRAGFEVVSLRERKVEESDVESGAVGKRGLKWVGMHVWYGVLLRKVG
ncbi:S-adenosyl-L-methionine-dependent methyltransferase [Massariosphaeria phaeospora]|uniref:S-adenosyl-L-methionine-dependent methyltransferase n=1 Tax=Massariosphaeria phaeospora TaxID=100035 RepID=A0A7C8IAU9_9PLEO|nr:S-adenosyl-L-methionine-dependent methyltransferase [Massariosphaeria phaeospora]